MKRSNVDHVGEPITDLDTAVREYGALPVPVGPTPDRLTRTFAAVQTLREDEGVDG